MLLFRASASASQGNGKTAGATAGGPLEPPDPLCQSLAPPGLTTLTADVVIFEDDAGERGVRLQRFANRLAQESKPCSSSSDPPEAQPGLGTLHADAVAFEVDAGECGVALQRFADRLTRESNPAAAPP